jgi:hypothetical protein
MTTQTIAQSSSAVVARILGAVAYLRSKANEFFSVMNWGLGNAHDADKRTGWDR